MSQGLDPKKELVLAWQWLPTPPLPLDEALPTTVHADEAEFVAPTADDGLAQAYRFSFPQLARQTGDLRFYRLMQLFNTPLLSMTTRDAGRSSFAYWRGKSQPMKEGQRFAYFWFFDDQRDQDLVVLEYGFAGGFAVRSRVKTPQEVKAIHATICARVRGT